MKVAVIGGAGFIGSSLVHDLIDERRCDSVLVIDDLSTGSLANLPEDNGDVVFEFCLFDVARESASDLAGLLQGCSVVFHLAANASVMDGVADPESMFVDNAVGTSNVVLACAEAKVQKIVYSSTCAVYEEKARMAETDAPKPANQYGLTKLLGEQIVCSAPKVHGIDTVALRYFNVYGPNQPERGAYTSVVQAFRRQAMKGKEHDLWVYGDGKQTRDFVHVSDVVAANVYFAFSFKPRSCTSKPVSGLVYNVGTGRRSTVNEIAALVLNAYDVKNEIVYKPSREGEIAHAGACVLRTAAAGFVSKVKLEDGIADLAERDGR